MSGERKWMSEFEILRAISILMLLIHHAGVYNLDFFGLRLERLSPYVESFLLGSFFLISGYFMEVTLQNSGGDLRKFIRSRFLRIYPPYLVALFLYVFVMGFTLRNTVDWLVYLSGLQFIFAPAFVKPILTLWYVSAILLYYAVFLVLWRVSSNNRVLVLVSVILFALARLAHHSVGLFDQRFFKYYFVFLIGMMLARRGESVFILSGRWVGLKGILAFVGIWLVSVVLQLEVQPTSIAYLVVTFMFIVSSVVFLFSLVANAGVDAPWRWVRGAAYASYFVYLFHRPLWAILEGIIQIPALDYQILFRVLPASAIVVITCYYLQSGYEFLIRGVGGKFNR